MKSGKTMVGGAAAGHNKYLQKLGPRVSEAGQLFAAQVLPDLQGKGRVQQRSLSADLIFGYFLSRESNSLRGN